jgi:hypothetical protein
MMNDIRMEDSLRHRTSTALFGMLRAADELRVDFKVYLEP